MMANFFDDFNDHFQLTNEWLKRKSQKSKKISVTFFLINITSLIILMAIFQIYFQVLPIFSLSSTLIL